MTPEMFSRTKKSLIKHESKKNFPYLDTVGKITIGIGYNLSDRGLSDEWVSNQFAEDCSYFYSQLCEFPWYLSLNEDRQVVLIDMAFMGFKKFLGFTEMIKALEDHNYERAALEMLNSKWAIQVGDRAHDLANGMLSGVYDP